MRLLDTFCKAGGTTKGNQRAGFEVVGVDIEPQPHYCGDAFIRADALDVLYALAHGDCWPDSTGRDWHLEDFDAIHASPPCGRYTGATAWRGNRLNHPDLIGPTQTALRQTRLPYVIENVDDARALLVSPFMLCGTVFGLNVQSHRWFEVNFPIAVSFLGLCNHTWHNVSRDHGKKYPESMLRASLGCMWMTVHEARQAIPPVYTEFIGKQLLNYLAQS